MGILCPLLLQAQGSDKEYVKNLKYRLLFSYISETRDLSTTLRPAKEFDPDASEKLMLKNSPSILSGFLFQADNIAYYWAAAVPQTAADKDRYGSQRSFITKGSILLDALLINVNYVNQGGFYDQNYLKHPEFAGDTVSFRRHNGTRLRWTSVDFMHYPGKRQAALGVPFYFGERQLKSKFFWGSRLAFNQVRLTNRDGALFRDSLRLQYESLQMAAIRNRAFSYALTPSAYLVAKKKLFLFMDASFGFAVGNTVINNQKRFRPGFRFEIPQAKIASGINTDRFLIALYYTYLDQTFKTRDITVGNVVGNFGFIAGFRFNQWRYRKLSWDTVN